MRRVATAPPPTTTTRRPPSRSPSKYGSMAPHPPGLTTSLLPRRAWLERVEMTLCRSELAWSSIGAEKLTTPAPAEPLATVIAGRVRSLTDPMFHRGGPNRPNVPSGRLEPAGRAGAGGCHGGAGADAGGLWCWGGWGGGSGAIAFR